MESTTEIIKLRTIDQFPSIDYIKNIPRNKKLKIVFSESINYLRVNIGTKLKEELPDFQIAIHNIEPEINITKLITVEEIIAFKKFFEKCAKDYRNLGEKLIIDLIRKKKIRLDPEFPFLTFFKMKSKKHHKGKINDWNYFFHGYHCHFKNIKTNQEIEVPIIFGMEFGDLDPYFFSCYIKSNQDYLPLPVSINEDYADGERIIDVMLNLNLFERINSNIEHHSGVVVRDRNKIEVKVYNPEKDFVKPKFNILKFLRIIK